MKALNGLVAAIRNNHESGNIALLLYPLAVLAGFLDRHGRYEAASTIAGFALNPMSEEVFPEFRTALTHLREVLGEANHESLARKGAAMSMAAIAAYAYDQIDEVLAELNAVGIDHT